MIVVTGYFQIEILIPLKRRPLYKDKGTYSNFLKSYITFFFT